VSRTRSGIRWPLFAIVLTLSLAVSAALFVAVAQGVLAASFLISNQEFKETAERVESFGVIQYGAVDTRYDGTNVPVSVTGTRLSRVTGVCQSVVARDVPFVGTFTVKLNAERVTARDSYRDVVQSIDGTVTAENPNNGIAAGASRKGPGIKEGDKADPGSSAQEADSIVVTDSKQILVAVSARITQISGSSLRFYKGVNECF
jgi:Family of unknown function (DUF6230)